MQARQPLAQVFRLADTLVGARRISASYASGVDQAAVLIGVRAAPGASPLTRMPRGASSGAIVFISIMTGSRRCPPRRSLRRRAPSRSGAVLLSRGLRQVGPKAPFYQRSALPPRQGRTGLWASVSRAPPRVGRHRQVPQKGRTGWSREAFPLTEGRPRANAGLSLSHRRYNPVPPIAVAKKAQERDPGVRPFP